jgi:CheY-like chemotaxis protein
MLSPTPPGRDPRPPAECLGRATPPGVGVLLAEDEVVLRRLLTQRFRRAGLTVWPAADGLQAVEVFRREGRAITVALLDIHMPGLDGTQVLSALREIDPALPCCFMTAGAHPFTREDLLRRGAADVLQKPFSPSEAIRILTQLSAPPPGDVSEAG